MEKIFPEVKKKLGFGCMRLRMKDTEVDEKNFCEMIDAFIENGFNYFDTAHGYIDGKSERAIKVCLSDRYERDKFLLADKLSDGFFEKQEDIEPFVREQLEICGVEYFDFYLMHALSAKNFPKYVRERAIETCFELKEKGLLRHVGMSFHDKAEVLDKILTEKPQIEFVQLQFNYADYDDENVESFKCYEVCKKHNKPVIVMEPVKGGSLVKLPERAEKILDGLKGGSYASYAIRFAASFDNIFMVLSGMGDTEMMNDNISYMKDFEPLNDTEMNALSKVRAVLKNLDTIPCTACRYCVAGCPENITIPDIFSLYNDMKGFSAESSRENYFKVTAGKGKASGCIECGKCEYECPQNIEIRKQLKNIVKLFEAK